MTFSVFYLVYLKTILHLILERCAKMPKTLKQLYKIIVVLEKPCWPLIEVKWDHNLLLDAKINRHVFEFFKTTALTGFIAAAFLNSDFYNNKGDLRDCISVKLNETLL